MPDQPFHLNINLSAAVLLAAVEQLEVPTISSAPVTVRLEHSLRVGPQYGRATYRDQKHHWTRWLGDYQPPDKSARRIYNAINCPTMLIWLSEGFGIRRGLLERASLAAQVAPPTQPSQTAAIRRLLPWHPLAAIIRPNFEINAVAVDSSRQLAGLLAGRKNKPHFLV
ncbi:MAG: hypothetical protein ABJN52_17025 [Litorimonas sp.]